MDNLNENMTKFLSDGIFFYQYLLLKNNLPKESKGIFALLLSGFYNKDLLITKDIDPLVMEIINNYLGIKKDIEVTIVYNEYIYSEFKLLLGLLNKKPNGEKINQEKLIIDEVIYNILINENVQAIFKSFPWYEVLVNSFKLSICKYLNIDFEPDKFVNDINLLKNSTLIKYGTYLNEEKILFNPAIGREKELEQIELGLLLKEKSILLVGPAGVGKTAIIKGLVYNIQNRKINNRIANLNIVKLNLNALLSGTTLRGEFEERIEKIINELLEMKDVLVYIESLNKTISLGKGSSSDNGLADILKPYLSEGDIRVISEASVNNYKEIIEDDSLKNKFKVIMVKEPDDLTLKSILDNSISYLESYYQINFDFPLTIRNIIIEKLINLTKNVKFYRENGQIDTKNNPSLVIDILKLIFVYAIYHNHTSILMSDVYEGILNSENVNENRKMEVLKSLKEMTNEPKRTGKLIRFPQR